VTRPRTWTDDDLRRVADGAESLIQISTALGLTQGSRTNKTLRRHAERLGLTLPNGWYKRRRQPAGRHP